MKKIFLFFVLMCNFCFGQLDTEHWFAPMKDKSMNRNYYQTLYFSTNEVVPFEVSVYNNNTIIGKVMVSKGNPAKYTIPVRKYIITYNDSDVFTPTTMGLYCKGDKKFFANLRFSATNHAEIITSKGKAGIGNHFYAVMAPLSVMSNAGLLNFTLGMMATEDNTTITVSGYKSGVQFSNGSTNTSFTINLNKGQSYIIEGTDKVMANWDGFIGAKIISNKPISVINGNFNGQYAGDFMNSSDILMDQSVPVDRLGNEFVLVKGNGDIGKSMESAIVVATENNTEVFVNGSTTPLAVLNEGQYFLVNDANYILKTSEHYNLHIKTSKNAYVYQLLAGVSGNSSPATGGFNYIPPLNCFLPKKIDEIGLIDENELYNNDVYSLNNATKLNIISEKGATISVNGVAPNATNGPFDVTGTTGWETYSFYNVSGNMTITSNKSITAGISAGNGAVGYGGFFAGFSSIPIVTKKSGECVPGIVLEVDPNYDKYQWLYNDNIIPDAISPTYIPSKSGYYSVKVTNGVCIDAVSPKFKVLNCIVKSSISEVVCEMKEFIPKFTQSSQIVIPSTVKIVTSPTKGNVIIQSTDGKIVYTRNPGTQGEDSFQYQFCGNDTEFTDCELVTVNIKFALELKDTVLKSCKENDEGVFDLTRADINAQSNPTQYFPTLNDAQNETNEIITPTAYRSSGGKVFGKVFSSYGCSSIATITLEFFELPNLQLTNYNKNLCDSDFDGKIDVDLSKVTQTIISNSNNFIIKYYDNQLDAELGNMNVLPNIWNYTTNQTIYMRIESKDFCKARIEKLDFIFGEKTPLKIASKILEICDDNTDGVKSVDLSTYNNIFVDGEISKISYYTTLVDAQKNRNPLTSTTLEIDQYKTLFFRIEKMSFCANIATLELKVKVPRYSDVLKDQKICPNSRATLNAGLGFQSYQWSTGETSSKIMVQKGKYWVILTDENSCSIKQEVKVDEIILPTIDKIDIKGSEATIIVSGATPPYRFSVDGGAYQDSNVFSNLSRGKHSVSVISADNCEAVIKEFTIINLVNAITPNDDGINDSLDYSDLQDKKEVKFNIYDRYGKKIFQGNSQNNFIWDGKYEGRPLPTASYWYELEWKDFGIDVPIKHSSWVLLKNRD